MVIIGSLLVVFGCGQNTSQLPQLPQLPRPTAISPIVIKPMCTSDDDCGPEGLCDKGICHTCAIDFEQTALPEAQSVANNLHTLEWYAAIRRNTSKCWPHITRMRFEFTIKRTGTFVPLFVMMVYEVSQYVLVKSFIVDTFSAVGDEFIMRAEWNGSQRVVDQKTSGVTAPKCALVCVNCAGTESVGTVIITRFQAHYRWDKRGGEELVGEHESIVQTIILSAP